MIKLFVGLTVLAIVMSIICPTHGDEAWLERKRKERDSGS